MRGHLTPEEIAERDERARARRARAEQTAAARTADAEERALYQQRLQLAAGISTVSLLCHPDTWRFIDGYASKRASWQNPTQTQGRTTKRSDNLTEIRLSGPQVVMVLIVMADACGLGSSTMRAPFVGDRVIAERVYEAVGTVVDTVDPDAPRGAAVPPIVIDDQAAQEQPAPDR